jgi:phage-related protein
MTALSRSGTTFTQQQRDMVKALVESGDTLGAQKLILDVVESQYGGMAETMAGTSSGQIKQALNTVGDSMEQFGAIIAPIIVMVADKFKQLGVMVQGLSPQHKELIVQVLAVAAAIGPVLVVGGKMISILSGITKAMHLLKIAFLTNPVGLVIAAIGALVAILVVAYFKFDGFRKFVDQVWQGIQAVISNVWQNFLKPIFEQLVAAFNNDILPALQNLWAAFMEAWPGIQNAIVTAWTFISPILAKIIEVYIFLYSVVLKALITYWTFVFTTIVQVVTWAWTTVLQPIFELIGWVIMNLIVPAALFLWNTMQTVWSAVSGAVSAAWGVLSSAFTSIKDGIAGVADWVGEKVGAIIGFFSAIGDGIRDGFRGAFNFVVRAWNSTLGGLKVPDLVPVIGGLSLPELQEFNKGGIVPGIQGEPMLAMVHGGERILRPSEVGGSNDTGGGGSTYNITINGMVGKDKRDILDFLARELPKAAATHSRSFG